MEPPDLIGPESVEPDSGEQERAEGVGPSASPDKPSQATRLVQLVEHTNATLFHDDREEGWIRFGLGDSQEHWPCRSKPAKRWLAMLYWNYEGKAPNSDAIAAAVNVLEAKARFEGKEHVLHNRVAAAGNDFLYDLTDKHWRAIRITPKGWSIEQTPPILFRRFAHQQSQATPRPGGDLRDLLSFVNLADPERQLLLLVYVVACFVPEIPHPVPVLHGPQGTAKTSFLRVVRQVVDPSITETLTAPRDVTELVQQLSHQWLAYYDNLTTIPEWLSNALCRAVTGAGFSKRGLYTDDDDVIYAFRRCCAINGINIAATKPDLLDRALLFELKTIPKRQRRTEKTMWAEFERMRPQLVGAALDALSKAMRIFPTVELGELDRMADFQLWGCAIAEALGYSRDQFLEAFERNYRDRNDEIIASDPVASAVMAHMEERERWEGTSTDLLGALDSLATKLKIDRRSKNWPSGANVLSRRLKEVAPCLAAAGIIVDQRRAAQQRTTVITRSGGRDANVAWSRAEDDDGDRDGPRSEPSPEKGRNLAWNDGCDDDDDVSPTSGGDAPSHASVGTGSGQSARDTPPTRKSPGNTVIAVTTVTGHKKHLNRELFSSDPDDDTQKEPSRGSSPGQAEPEIDEVVM